MLTPSILPAGAPGTAAITGRRASGTLPRRFMGDSATGGDDLMRPRTPAVAALAAVVAGLTAGAVPAAARTARVDVLRQRALARADHARPYPLQAGPAHLASTAKKHKGHKKKTKKNQLVRSGTMCPERTTSRVTGLVARGGVRQIGRYRARVSVSITATASAPLTVQVGRSVFHDPYNTARDLSPVTTRPTATPRLPARAAPWFSPPPHTPPRAPPRLEPFSDYYWKTTNLNLQAGTHDYRLPTVTITSREPTWVSTSNIKKV